MKALIDIARVGARYLKDYVTSLINMTAAFVQSDYEKIGQLSLEFWTSIFEAELKMTKHGESFQSIVLPYGNDILNLFLLGLSKIDPNREDADLGENHDESNWTISMSAGSALENFALIMKDDIVQPVLNFVF